MISILITWTIIFALIPRALIFYPPCGLLMIWWFPVLHSVWHHFLIAELVQYGVSTTENSIIFLIQANIGLCDWSFMVLSLHTLNWHIHKLHHGTSASMWSRVNTGSGKRRCHGRYWITLTCSSWKYSRGKHYKRFFLSLFALFNAFARNSKGDLMALNVKILRY